VRRHREPEPVPPPLGAIVVDGAGAIANALARAVERLATPAADAVRYETSAAGWIARAAIAAPCARSSTIHEMRLWWTFSTGLLLALAAGAQDEVLAVERREDVRARDAAAQLLRGTKVDFVAAAMTPKDLCRTLALLAASRLNFAFAARGDAAATPAFDLELRHANLWGVMAAVQQATGLRFVYRAGVVFLVGRDDVRPLMHVQVYDLRWACAKLRSFPGPRLELPTGEGEQVPFPPEEETEHTVSGYTAELLETLIKESVAPDSWSDGKASLTNKNGLFVVRQTPAGHAALRRLFDELGLIPLPRVVPAVPARAAPRLRRGR
jgi:hypothetical protein